MLLPVPATMFAFVELTLGAMTSYKIIIQVTHFCVLCYFVAVAIPPCYSYGHI